MNIKNQQIAENLVDIFTKLKEQRLNLETTWQDVNKYIKPQKNHFLQNQNYNAVKNVYDSSAMLACDHLASFIWSLVNSNSLNWFKLNLKTKKPTKEQNKWADHVSKLIIKSLASPELGFYHKSFELYNDLVSYGTAIFYLGSSTADKLMYLKTISLKDCYIMQSEFEEQIGIVRKILFSKQDYLRVFGKSADIKTQEDLISVLHFVVKADVVKDDKNLLLGKNWSSFYIKEDSRRVISHNGYSTCPYFVLRWGSSSHSLYGESPAILALPDIKMLNEIAKTMAIFTQRQANPPILVAKENSIKGAKIAPGSLIKGGLNSATGESLIKALYFNGKQEDILNFYEKKKQAVLDAFYNSTILNTYNTKQMSATEVDLNKEQQLNILEPKIARIQSEFLYPFLKRKYQIMKNLGLIPAINGSVPDVKEIEISFKGLWSKYQKLNDINNINSALKTLNLTKEVSEDAIKNIDWQAFTRSIVESYSISEK